MTDFTPPDRGFRSGEGGVLDPSSYRKLQDVDAKLEADLRRENAALRERVRVLEEEAGKR